MARVTLNYNLSSLNGRIGDVVFYQRFGRQFMRPYVKPGNPNTPAQRARRGAFREAVKAWQAIPEEQRREWNAYARRAHKSGYNFFISRYLIGTAMESAPKDCPVRIQGSGSRAIFLRLPERSALSSLLLRASDVTAPFRAGSRAYLPYAGRKSRL